MMRCNQDGAHRPPVHHALWTLPSRSSPVERDLAACLRMLRPPDAAVGAMTCTVQATAKQRDAAESPERALRRAHARQRLGRRSRIQRSCSRTAGSHRLPDGTGWPARCTRTASRRRRRRSAWLLRRPTWRSCGPHWIRSRETRSSWDTPTPVRNHQSRQRPNRRPLVHSAAYVPDNGETINCALHRFAVTKGRLVADTAAYLARKQAEGKSRREALRRLKRHLARRVWRLLQPHADLGAPTASPPPTITIHCNVPNGGLSLT